MNDSNMSTSARVLTTITAGALLGLGMVGCQSQERQADGFGVGADRPPTPRTLHMMAKLINENGRFDQAEFVLKRVIRDTPDYLPAHVELADLYIERGRFGDAIATLDAAHAIAPNDPVIANNLGVLKLREKDFSGASAAFLAAAALDAGEARYHANLAVSFAMQGAYERAFHAWAAVLPPDEVFWNIGVVAEARGDQSIANEHFAAANDIRKGVAEPGGIAVAYWVNPNQYGPMPEPAWQSGTHSPGSSPVQSGIQSPVQTTATVSVPVD